MWAGEQYVGHWDGYSVTTGPLWPNNYYLHSDATGRFTMLASGLDQTFSASRSVPGRQGRAADLALPRRRLVPAGLPLEPRRGLRRGGRDRHRAASRRDRRHRGPLAAVPEPRAGRRLRVAGRGDRDARVHPRPAGRGGRLPRGGRSRAEPGARVDTPAAAELRRLPAGPRAAAGGSRPAGAGPRPRRHTRPRRPVPSAFASSGSSPRAAAPPAAIDGPRQHPQRAGAVPAHHLGHPAPARRARPSAGVRRPGHRPREGGDAGARAAPGVPAQELHLLLIGVVQRPESLRRPAIADRPGALHGQPTAHAALGRGEDGRRQASCPGSIRFAR